MRKILLFPGQGAQRVGMARDLAEAFPAARQTLDAIDEALGAARVGEGAGEPRLLSTLMFEGPEAALQLTHFAQPAILAHSAAVLAAVGPRLGSVIAAAGHSLGEYSAYLAAGSLQPTDAARLVRRRGELMLEAGRARPGTMAAVLGLDTAAVEEACRAASGSDGIAIAANLNAPDQTVISGDPGAVTRAGDACKRAGAKRVVPLKVSGAFHSPLMEPAVPGLREALAGCAFGDPAFPVIANATAEPVIRAEAAIRLLVDQLTGPVRWVDSMRAAAALARDATFVELGPGAALAGLLKRIAPEARVVTLGTRSEVEAFLS